MFSKIIPPPEWGVKPNEIGDDFMIEKIITQKFQVAGKGVLVHDYDVRLISSKTFKEFCEEAVQLGLDTPDENSETSFWNCIKQPDTLVSLYGIDNEVSLFPKTCLIWNMNNVNVLRGSESLIHKLEHNIPGINTKNGHFCHTIGCIGKLLKFLKRYISEYIFFYVKKWQEIYDMLNKI